MVGISGAYMQSGLIKKDIYVRIPQEWMNEQRGRMWKLLKLPYGVNEAGRQCEEVIEDWLTNTMGFQQVK